MVKFIAKRLAISVVLLFIVTTLVFAFVHMMPGDPVLTMLGVDSNPDPVTVEKIRTELGLDQPILVQYGNYLKGIVKLDLGKSYSEKIPVVQAIASRFPRTLELAFVSLVLACLAGIPLGIIAAVRRGKLSDLMLTTVASVGTSVPVYVLGYLLVVVFALNIFNLPIAKLPASGFTAFSKDPAMHIQKIILPAVTLALGIHHADDALLNAGRDGGGIHPAAACKRAVGRQSHQKACNPQCDDSRYHDYRPAAWKSDWRNRTLRDGI